MIAMITRRHFLTWFARVRELVSAVLLAVIVISFAASSLSFADDNTVETDGCDNCATTSEIPHYINLVLDDSGSMTDGSPTRWAKAIYGLQIFASGLGANDELHIYTLNGGKVADMTGQEPLGQRVSKVSQIAFLQGNTPSAEVVNAYSDLKAQTLPAQTQRHLIVFTDGAWTDKAGDAAMAQIQADASISVIYELFNSSNIYDGIMEDFSQTFNLYQKTGASLNVDIKLQELTIVAQGQNPQIGDAKLGSQVLSPSQPLSNVSSPDGALNAVLAQYSNVETGQFSADIQNATNATIFAKPNVTIKFEIADEQGKLVSDCTSLAEGKYTPNWYFIDEAGNKLTTILGETPQLFGSYGGVSIKPGQPIQLTQGQAEFAIKGQLGNTVFSKSPNISMQVLKQVDTSMNAQILTYKVSQLDTSEYAPITTVDAQTRQPLQNVDLSSISKDLISATNEKGEKAKVEWEVVPGSNPAEFKIRPQWYRGDKYDTDTGIMHLSVECAKPVSTAVEVQYNCLQNAEFDIEIIDDIDPLERLLVWLWKLLLALLLLLLILGTIFKKRFSRSFKDRPTLDIATPPGKPRRESENGKITKSWRHFPPFKAQSATIKYVPAGVATPAIKVKAKGQGRLKIINIASLKNYKTLEIDGVNFADPEQKPKEEFSEGMSISYKDEDGYRYECNPKL